MLNLDNMFDDENKQELAKLQADSTGLLGKLNDNKLLFPETELGPANINSINNANPFNSRNYPFSKNWSNYSAPDLGRAFFSDGVTKTSGAPEVYDNIGLFSNSSFIFSNEPVFYKRIELKFFIYTLTDLNALIDKYNKVSLATNEMCVFFCKTENIVTAKLKLGESLLKSSRFENARQASNFFLESPLDEIQSLNLSTKNIIDFFSKDKPLFVPDAIELTEVLFVDAKGNVITQRQDEILGTKISDIVYGERIKIRIIGRNVPHGTVATVKLLAETGNENQIFAGIEDKKWTLTFNNNQEETGYFKIPLTWFDEAIEEYNYRRNINRPLESEPKAYKTTFVTNKLNRFKVEVSYGSGQILRTKNEHVLIPTSYRRNYEELIGLFKKDDDSGSKTTKENYENHFISDNEEIKKTVDEFVKFVEDFPAVYQDDPEATTQLNVIKERVKKDAKALWKNAVEPFKREKFDDRPLYWARLKMQAQLKRLAIFKPDIDFDRSLVKRRTKLEGIITTFEENSRNYTGINFIGAAPGTRKVLITGFDPFILNPQPPVSGNILQSNPSGCVALYLAANSLSNSIIQTMIVPVRYTDFDNSEDPEKGQGEGIIEKYINPWINTVDMIITISQAGPGDYHIDVFATATRGGSDDNMHFLRKNGSKSVSEISPETIRTTLPDEITLNGSRAEFYGKYFITREEYFRYAGNSDSSPHNSTKASYPTEKIYDGPGSNYLSNEIFYRVAKLRLEQKPELKTGHFHISMIQIREDFSNRKTKELILVVKKSLKSAGL